jgi:outer membrane protein
MNHLLTRGRSAALAFALGAALLAVPASGANDVSDIGSLDQQALAALPQFQAANKQLNTYGASLQKQYVGRAQHASQSDQQRLAAEFQSKMADKQRQLFGPLFGRAQVAIASVASSKNLTVVVDKRIVVFGGQDITNSVKDLLTGVGDPVPPVSTPPPSRSGTSTSRPSIRRRRSSRSPTISSSSRTTRTKRPPTSSRAPRPPRTATPSSRITARRSTISRTRRSSRWWTPRAARSGTSRSRKA